MDPFIALSNRRTVRKYDHSRPLSIGMIDDMLAVAARAANTGNMQTYSVIVTVEPDEIAALAPAHFNQPAAVNAQAVLTFCVDFNRFNRWCAINNAVPGLENLQGFTWGVMDTAIFAQQFCTVAELNGLGTCYLGTTTYNAPMIADSLSLPAGVVPVITVTVGYPAEEPELQLRLPLDAVVHHGKYHNPTDDEIRAAYAEEEAEPSAKRFVEENGKENLAQVFADIRYPKAANEQFSRLFKEFLKNQGIAL